MQWWLATHSIRQLHLSGWVLFRVVIFLHCSWRFLSRVLMRCEASRGKRDGTPECCQILEQSEIGSVPTASFCYCKCGAIAVVQQWCCDWKLLGSNQPCCHCSRLWNGWPGLFQNSK